MFVDFAEKKWENCVRGFMYYRRRRRRKFKPSDLSLLGYDEERLKKIILKEKKIKKIPFCQKCGAQGEQRQIRSGQYGLYLQCTQCNSNVGVKVNYDITKDEQMQAINRCLEEYNKYLPIVKKNFRKLMDIKIIEGKREKEFYEDAKNEYASKKNDLEQELFNLRAKRAELVEEAKNPGILSSFIPGLNADYIRDPIVAQYVSKSHGVYEVKVNPANHQKYLKLLKEESEYYWPRITELTDKTNDPAGWTKGSAMLYGYDSNKTFYEKLVFDGYKAIHGIHAEAIQFFNKIKLRNPNSPRELKEIEDEYYFPLVKEKEERLKLFKKIFKLSDSNSWIYVLANNAMPGLYKVGWTERNPIDRVKDLSTTGLPEPFKVVYEHNTNLTMDIEKKIHDELDAYRHRGNREFFKTDLSTIKKIIKETIAKEPEI